MKKIVFFTNTLTAGGAERVMVNMASYLAKSDYKIYLLTTAKKEDFYDLGSDVTRVCLDDEDKNLSGFKKITRFLSRFIKLRQFLRKEKPEVVISFLENVNILNALACLFLPVSSIISIRNDPRMNKIGLILSTLRRIIYPLADRLVVQTNAVLTWSESRNLNRNIVVVPNSVKTPSSVKQKTSIDGESFKLVAAGRLVPQKGFDRLIDAMSLVSKEVQNIKLDIYGTGPLLEEFQSKVRTLNLEDKIFFKGLTKELPNKLVESDAFVLSSRYEGFPNVLLEAMSMGVPSISFDCKSGPADIIINNVDGVLVPDGDTRELANSIIKLMADDELRSSFNKNSISNIKRYEISKIMTEWEGLF